MMLHEGLGTFLDVSGSCGIANPAYKCRDCVSMELFCSGCIISNYSHTPCHQLKVRHFTISSAVCWAALEMEWIFLGTIIIEGTWPPIAAWPPSWRNLQQSWEILWRWLCPDWHAWHIFYFHKLLQLWICPKPSTAAAPHVLIPHNNHTTTDCSNFPIPRSISFNIFGVKDLHLWVL